MEGWGVRIFLVKVDGVRRLFCCFIFMMCELFKCCKEFIWLDWFGDISVYFGFFVLCFKFLYIVCGYGNDRGVIILFFVLSVNMFCCF